MHGPLTVLKNGDFLKDPMQPRTCCCFWWLTLLESNVHIVFIKIGPHDNLLTQRTYKALVCYTMIYKLTQPTFGIIMLNKYLASY